MTPDFDTFFRHVTGQPPFAWQSRMAREVVDAGVWPAYVALPTAAGKTILVEIWAYALARDIARGVESRRVPLRLVWVVDRRIVVDAVAERARRLADVLRAAEAQPEHPLSGCAAALRGRGAAVPLAVAQLRGGMVGQRRWVDAPNQPVVLSTTVDQAGSRLLFRGYGLSPYQYSLEAGLLACDTLVVVDEAHLSRPFAATLAGVSRQCRTAEREVARPLQAVVMSATLPPGTESGRFSLAPEERAELSGRLARPKWTALVRAQGGVTIAEALRAAARRRIQSTGGVIAVIVNRVDTAREVFIALAADHDAVLLTGRIRPYDRQILLDAWIPRLRAGRTRDPEAPPRVVVATQTVEVGADFDFDALVTEVAPFSALRQRFGRLNRLGTRAEAAAEIVQREAEDGVYPHDVVKGVWAWLAAHSDDGRDGRPPRIDLSDEAVTRLLAQGDTPPDVQPVDAPILTRAHVERWVQTSPVPDPDPDPEPFLHGKQQSAPADVQLLWRADVEERGLLRAIDQSDARAQIEGLLSALLDLAPPSVEEAIGLPVWAVTRWLTGGSGPAQVADVEGSGTADDAQATDAPARRAALRWDGRDATVVLPAQIRPGDTIVVPAAYGGTDAFGWHPRSAEAVRDVGDVAGRGGRRRQRLRLHPLVLGSLLGDVEDAEPWVTDLRATLAELGTERHPDVDAARGAVEERLAAYAEAILPHLADDARTALERWRASPGRWIPYPSDRAASGQSPAGVVLEWVPSADTRQPDADPIVDEADEGSMIGVGRAPLSRAVTLAEHGEAVATCAATWARGCGLLDRLARALEWAGRLHDIGKCEPRFQVMLHGGDEAAAAIAPEPLAKSGMDPHDRVRLDRARRRARLPDHLRHEAISARLVLDALDRLPADVDRDLVCFLVGTHHGRGRPWFPIVEDPEPTEVVARLPGMTFVGGSATRLERIDAGWPDRFAALQRRYGAWGLAYLEAIVRLADHRVSSQEVQA